MNLPQPIQDWLLERRIALLYGLLRHTEWLSGSSRRRLWTHYARIHAQRSPGQVARVEKARR